MYRRRSGRIGEGARLESGWGLKTSGGSNPSFSVSRDGGMVDTRRLERRAERRGGPTPPPGMWVASEGEVSKNLPGWWNGRHRRLKISCPYGRGGSNPPLGTIITKFGRVAEWLKALAC